MIPKKIHYICKDGYDNLSDVQKEWIQKSKKTNSSFKIVIWDKNDILNNDVEYTKFHILYNEGGIYIDFNVSVSKIPEEWLKDTIVIAKQHKSLLCSNIVGGTKKNRFFKKCLDSLSETTSIQETVTIAAIETFGKYSIQKASNGEFESNNLIKFIKKPRLRPKKVKKNIND